MASLGSASIIFPQRVPPSSSARVPVCGCCNGSQIHLSFMEQQAAKRSRNEVQWLPGKTERKPEAGAGPSHADSPRRCTFWIRSFSFVSLRRITDKSNFRWKRFLLAHSSGYSPSWPRRPGGRRRGSWSRDTCREINAGAQLASSFHTVQEPSQGMVLKRLRAVFDPLLAQSTNYFTGLSRGLFPKCLRLQLYQVVSNINKDPP